MSDGQPKSFVADPKFTPETVKSAEFGRHHDPKTCYVLYLKGGVNFVVEIWVLIGPT